MYLAIDIGGTKTLVAIFDTQGNKIAEKKISTDHDYAKFLKDVENCVAEISTDNLIACALAIPGKIDRKTGVAISLGNLDWRNIAIRDNVSEAIGGTKVIIENDAKTAGLAEANYLKDQYRKVLYMTISTGIGVASIIDGVIPDALQDIEMGLVPLYYDGKLQPWEDFASGKSISETYGKLASEIEDEKTWKEIGLKIAYGTAMCCGAFQPEAIVYGGGAGKYADKFKHVIYEYLKENLHPNINQPRILLPAHFPDDSVVRGCYILLKQKGLIT